MNDTEHLIELAQQQCEQINKKLTPIRTKVLTLLIEAKTPLSAYDLLDRYKANNDSGCQPMTIYRALDFLEEAQLIHKLASTRQYVLCEHLEHNHEACEHHHRSQFLMCHSCGKTEEAILPDKVWEQIKQQALESNFQIDQPNLEIQGVCKSCQEKSKS